MLRVDAFAVGVGGIAVEDSFIDVAGEVVLFGERSAGVSAVGHLQHEAGVDGTEDDDDRDDRPPAAGEEGNRAGDAVDQADALQHAGEAKVRRIEHPAPKAARPSRGQRVLLRVMHGDQ
jgi:hypothetical protein